MVNEIKKIRGKHMWYYDISSLVEFIEEIKKVLTRRVVRQSYFLDPAGSFGTTAIYSWFLFKKEKNKSLEVCNQNLSKKLNSEMDNTYFPGLVILVQKIFRIQFFNSRCSCMNSHCLFFQNNISGIPRRKEPWSSQGFFICLKSLN